MRRNRLLLTAVALAGLVLIGSGVARAQAQNEGPNRGALRDCSALPLQYILQTALKAAQGQANGGFGLNMWGTIVNRDGVVCAVAFTGSARGDQWPGSRVISA